jgi:hypothetical protein
MSGVRAEVLLDLNCPVFQRQLFALPKPHQLAVLRTLRRLSQMTWDLVVRDAGLRWEAILGRTGQGGQRLYTLRVTGGFRAVALREGDWLRLLSLHPDHDSASER